MSKTLCSVLDLTVVCIVLDRRCWACSVHFHTLAFYMSWNVNHWAYLVHFGVAGSRWNVAVWFRQVASDFELCIFKVPQNTIFKVPILEKVKAKVWAPKWRSGPRHCISDTLVRIQTVSQLDVIGSPIGLHTIGPASSVFGQSRPSMWTRICY